MRIEWRKRNDERKGTDYLQEYLRKRGETSCGYVLAYGSL
jgi:hypothetical protein